MLLYVNQLLLPSITHRVTVVKNLVASREWGKELDCYNDKGNTSIIIDTDIP